MNENPNINLTLNVAEVNVILRSLGKHPFEEIAQLVQKIKDQGESQLAAMNTEPVASIPEPSAPHNPEADK